MNIAQWVADLRFALRQNITTAITAGVLATLLVLYVSLYVGQLGRFPDNYDIISLANTALPLAIVAIGQTIVVVTKGLDLSVGGIMSVANVIAATTMHTAADAAIAAPLIVLAGCAFGAVNGYLVAWLRLAPILVTLGTLSILGGVAIMILPAPGGGVPRELTLALSNPTFPLSLLYIVLLLVLWFVFRRTRLGVGIFAIGNDESAADAQGVPVRSTKMTAYVLSGGLAALAGLVFTARTTAGDPLSGDTFVLMSIAAVFLGGASLFGGRASAIGTVMGALSLTLITSVLFFADINPLYQSFFEGLLLVGSVGLGIAVATLGRRRRKESLS